MIAVLVQLIAALAAPAKRARRPRERIGIATMNAHHVGQGRDGLRMRRMVEIHLERLPRQCVIGVQEANQEGYEALLKIPGITVYKGGSNSRRGDWTGNLIVLRGLHMTAARSRRVVYMYRTKRGRRWLATNHSPIITAVTERGQAIRVRAVHIATKRNSSDEFRDGEYAQGRVWLVARRAAALILGDFNTPRPFKLGNRVRKLVGHHVDLVFGNHMWGRELESGVADFKVLGLTDHKSPWTVRELRPSIRQRTRDRLTLAA